MRSKSLSVFEHQSIFVDGDFFKEMHFKALVKYNDLHGSKYFTVGHNKITFKSFIGVIQVGQIVIEILPKADHLQVSDPATIHKWQSALLYMLNRAGYIRLNETDIASQDATKYTLLEVYLYAFIKEVGQLVHAGLIKSYRQTVKNQTALKGRLLIHKQIQHNYIHQERLYTEHAVYNTNNLINSIIKRALTIIHDNSYSFHLKTEVAKLLLYFEQIDSWFGATTDLDRIRFNRKTEAYAYPIELAKLIILNFCPDMSAGQKPVLALLFDMNKLFERFIYGSLKKAETAYRHINLSVNRQCSQVFWKTKTIKPDIIINYRLSNGNYRNVIIDTKWKIVSVDNPSDDDLKQMYTYNLQFGADCAILFYPKINQVNNGISNFEAGSVAQEFAHGCTLYFANLFDDSGKISDLYAADFIDEILSD